MSLTAIVFWVAYVGGLCGAVVYPVVGVALYVLVYHVHPETQWWGSSFEQAGIRTSLTVAAATTLGILLRRPRFEHGARQFPLPIVLMLALVGYALLSTTWVDVPGPRTTYMAEKIVKLAIFVLILVRCVRKPADYYLIFLSWLVGVAYIGYQAWGEVGASVGGRLTRGLGGPDFATSSGLSVHLVATLPLLGALFFMARTWWGRGFALMCGALTVNTILMTRTRNALVGLAAMSFMTLFWLPRGYRAKGFGAILVGTLLAVQLTDPAWWNRMRTTLDRQKDAAIAGRLVYWRAAIDMARKEPLGIGLGQFHLRIQEYTPNQPAEHSSHSMFFGCLAEFAAPGITLLMAILVVTLVRLSRARRASYVFPSDTTIDFWRWSPRFHLGWHSMALQSALVGYLGCAMFTARLWSEDFWILVGLAACLQNVRIHMQAHAVQPESGRGQTDSAQPRPSPAVPAPRVNAPAS